MQISKLVLALAPFSAVLALGACKDEPAPTATELAAADDELGVVQCAIGEGSTLGPNCTLERVQGEDYPEIIVRHSGGSFQRFELLDSGRGLRTADGAEEADLSLDGDMLIVRVADNQYRFPATISGRDETGE